MKVTNQPDGLYTIEASQDNTITNTDESTTTTPTTPSQEEDDERGCKEPTQALPKGGVLDTNVN